MKTSQQYLERLGKMRANIYLNGECIDRKDPRVVKSAGVVAMTFDYAQKPEWEELFTATSHLSGKKINRFTHIHQSPQDLMNKQDMIRRFEHVAGGCVQRCMGMDVINGLSVATKDCDIKYGTTYNERFLKYLAYFQENDLVAACGQTDPKGDRSLRPHQQSDPDQYLHVVERRPDGVVICGAKLHNTIAPYADEIICIPTRALTKEEGDWAIACAIPADAEGVYLIGRYCRYMPREEELMSPYGLRAHLESFTVFDHVFVPNERIFLNGETDIGGQLALLFALYHRHSYTGCKPGITDVIMGATALSADYLGIEKKEHVRSKLAELVSIAELVYAAGLASAVKSKKAASGTQVPDIIFANVGRRHAGHNIYHEYNTLADISGGLPATIPLNTEYLNPAVGKYVRKYCARRAGVSEESHYRCAFLVADLITSEQAIVSLIAGVHGGGSPIMEDIAIMGSYDMKSKKEIAKYLAGIVD